MLTADAMNGFKDHVKKTVSHAMYKITAAITGRKLQTFTWTARARWLLILQ